MSGAKSAIALLRRKIPWWARKFQKPSKLELESNLETWIGFRLSEQRGKAVSGAGSCGDEGEDT